MSAIASGSGTCSGTACCGPVTFQTEHSASSRELTCYRTRLVRERAREVNRIQKTLEGANVKLGDVASDVLGMSRQRFRRDDRRHN